MIAPCGACGFQPWSPDNPKCEATGCIQPATSWWHTKAGLHWLACDRHAQPKASSEKTAAQATPEATP